MSNAAEEDFLPGWQSYGRMEWREYGRFLLATRVNFSRLWWNGSDGIFVHGVGGVKFYAVMRYDEDDM
jgi:hypothetical protein